MLNPGVTVNVTKRGEGERALSRALPSSSTVPEQILLEACAMRAPPTVLHVSDRDALTSHWQVASKQDRVGCDL